MTMVSGNTLAHIAALVGDPARANLLMALMDGRALTAGELAGHAGVTPQTTSGHLSKLVEARIVVVERQGRHRYHRVASGEVAQALESLMALAAIGPPRHRPTGPRDARLRAARTCYDHIAGRLGTGIADALQARGAVVLGADGDAAALTPAGTRFFAEALDIRLDGAGRRPVCRACLDWSERRPHLAGRLGAALCAQAHARGWVERVRDSRALAVTDEGRRAFRETLGVAEAALP